MGLCCIYRHVQLSLNASYKTSWDWKKISNIWLVSLFLKHVIGQFEKKFLISFQIDQSHAWRSKSNQSDEDWKSFKSASPYLTTHSCVIYIMPRELKIKDFGAYNHLPSHLTQSQSSFKKKLWNCTWMFYILT